MEKRILFIAHSADLYGASRALIKLVHILLAEQYTVFVLIPEEGPLVSALQQALPLQQILQYEGLFYFTRKAFRAKHMFASVCNFISDVRRIRKIIHQYQIDIVHTNSGIVPAPALAARLSGSKHIWHIREWFGDFTHFWPLYKWYMISNSVSILCVSHSIHSQFDTSPKAVAVYDGVIMPEPLAVATLGHALMEKLQHATLVIGCTSRLRLIRKGQEYLIQALGLLRAKGYTGIQCLLIGGTVPGYEFHQETMQSMVAEYGLEEQVHFLGEVDSVLPYYPLFHLLVLPSGEPEPFGGVVLEAMSMSLPVIGSNVGGTVEQIEDGWNGYLFRNQDATDLAAKIELFLLAPDTITLFGKRSRKRVQELFSLEKHAQHIQALYKQL